MSIDLLSPSVSPAPPEILSVGVEPQFDFLSNEYTSLYQRSRATVFQRPEWLHALHRELAPAFVVDAVTVLVRHGRQLVFVLPLVRHHVRGLKFLHFADFGVTDYGSAIYDPADELLLLADPRLPEQFAAQLPTCDVVSLSKLVGDDPVLERLFPKARRAQMRVSAYPVKLGPSWNEWRNSTLEPGFRRDLEVKRRRLERRAAPRFMLLREASEIAPAFDALRQLRASRFGERGAHDVMQDDAVFSFYRQLAIEGAVNGTTRTFCLEVEGKPGAVLFGLARGQTFSLLLVGFDVVRFRRLSLGLLAIEDSLRVCSEMGDAIYDFTIGDYPYKLQFGGQMVPLHEWHIARSMRGRLAVLGVELVREGKRVLKPLIRNRSLSRPSSPSA